MNDKERQYKGVSDCVKQMIQKEGPRALYKGFGMCWARVSVPSVTFMFSVSHRVTHELTIGAAWNAHHPEFRSIRTFEIALRRSSYVDPLFIQQWSTVFSGSRHCSVRE